MNKLWELVLITSIYGSIVGGIILITKHVFKNKLNAKWGYVIWLVLLFKLIVPFGPESNFSIFNSNIISEYYVNEDNVILKNNEKYLENNQSNNVESIGNNDGDNLGNINQNITDENNNLSSENGDNIVRGVGISSLISYMWLLGALFVGVTFIISHYLLHKRIRESIDYNKLNNSEKERISFVLNTCKAKLNINKDIDLVINEIVCTPSIVGVINTKILIPQNIINLSNEELKHIFLHELCHLKRKDILVNYILLIIQSVHFFNPMIWYLFKKLREDMELATDEMVLNLLSEEEHKSYGKTILTVLEKIHYPNSTPTLIGIIDDKDGVKKRINNIKNMRFMKNKKNTFTIVGVVIFLILSTLLLTSGVNIKDLEQSNLLSLYMEIVDKDIKGRNIGSKELNKLFEKVEVEKFNNISGIVSNMDESRNQYDYNTDIFNYSMGDEKLSVAYLIDEKTDKTLDKIDSIDWTLNFNNKNETQITIYYKNGKIASKYFNIGVYPENLSQQKELFLSIEDNSEIYEKYFYIAKLIEDDMKVSINELNSLMNINLVKMDYSYEVDSDTKTYLYEYNKYSIYIGYNEKESKPNSIHIENEEKHSLNMGYNKEAKSGIQIWKKVKSLKEQNRCISSWLKIINYNRDAHKPSTNNEQLLPESNILECAEKLSMVRGYSIVPETQEEVMNGDSVSFDMMVEACVKGGYKIEDLTKEDSHIRIISFEVVEKSKDNNKIYLCLLVNENNEMLGAFLDYSGEPLSFKSVDDIENMRIDESN